MNETTPDVIVVGGGIIGGSIAWELAGHGLRVTLVERDRPGAGASSAAAGILIPEADPARPPEIIDLYQRSLRLYGDFMARLLADTGLPVEYRATGRLVLTLDEAEAATLEQDRQTQRAAGIRAEVWDAAAVRSAEPALTAATGALFFPDHALVDNARLTANVAMAAARRGVTILTGHPATGLHVRHGRVLGVELAGERLAADVVVNAAGSWAGLLDARAWLPVAPAKGQMLAFETRPPPVRRIIGSRHGVLVPRADGRLLCGATVEDVGYDATVTAGAIEGLLRGAFAVLPALRNCRLESLWAGLRPRCTADELPIIGPDHRLRGLYHATGHFKMGIISAPITAQAIAAVVMGRESPLPLDAFAPGRFATGTDG